MLSGALRSGVQALNFLLENSRPNLQKDEEPGDYPEWLGKKEGSILGCKGSTFEG